MEFEKFPKIARLSREIVITEKIDGTNAQIYIGENGEFLTGSRKRWITPDDDNFGFSRWAHEHKEELINGLGIGRHYGEWWGSGIQRGYGLPKGEKRFSLFNTNRWSNDLIRPQCCYVVPILYCGNFDTNEIINQLDLLKLKGSVASPGFMDPEGVVIFHTASSTLYKKTILNDEKGKGLES